MRNYRSVEVEHVPRELNLLIVGYLQDTQPLVWRRRPITSCGLDAWTITGLFLALAVWMCAFVILVIVHEEISAKARYLIAIQSFIVAVLFHVITTIWIACCFRRSMPHEYAEQQDYEQWRREECVQAEREWSLLESWLAVILTNGFFSGVLCVMIASHQFR
jgi:hypothetical protein